MSLFSEDGSRLHLQSPTLAPQAGAYLWNRRMMIQLTCRGYAVAQFMQPEPAKYAHVPTLAGTSFMQPEQPFFAHHPGRFFYLRDDDSGETFSVPYEPMRVALDRFEFSPGLSDVRWSGEKGGLRVELSVTLSPDDVAELWTVRLKNVGASPRRVSLVPYFPVGYSSWMNLSAAYDEELRGVVAKCIAPYQKLQDYFKRRHWKDMTYLVGNRQPVAWEACQARFEGEGGLHSPTALEQSRLPCGEAIYEIPACVLQYELSLASGASEELRLVFGPAKDREEIAQLKQRLLSGEGFTAAASAYGRYVASRPGCIRVKTPDETFDHFVNHWLPRQVFYHGDTNRLCTDPQTRNYLQDGMGMAYVDPQATRQVLLRALSQQKASGEMPDGILLSEDAELKYINQIPHTDHGVWLGLCLRAYLAETGDDAILDAQVAFADSEEQASVFEHMRRAMHWLVKARDERKLSFIAQGDWCDPMNMVGYKGKGVSGWLTEAVSFALSLWAPLCEAKRDAAQVEWCRKEIEQLNAAINEHLWDGHWYARGITDDGVAFGVQSDEEGRIFLNAQSWAFLCGAPNADQQAHMLAAIAEHLDTPYGVQLFAPAYTAMREDVGRVTQKFPGSGENGSVYNHAAAFYAASLYHIGRGDLGFSVLRRMLAGPSEEDIARRGQLPAYIPNYYRGAYRQFPSTAGRSSQLFNTGTAAWFYQLVVEQLFGLRGEGDALHISPQLPAEWDRASATRTFRGASIDLTVERSPKVTQSKVRVDGEVVEDGFLRHPREGQTYEVHVLIPARQS